MKTIAITWFGCFMGCFAILGGILPLWAPGDASEVPTSALARLGGVMLVNYGAYEVYDNSVCGTGATYCYPCGGHGCYCTDYEYYMTQNAPGWDYLISSTLNCSGFMLCAYYPDCTVGCMGRAGIRRVPG
jgi:hypothetical protein